MRLSVPRVVPHCHVPLDVVNCEVAERLLMCSVARIDSGVLRLKESVLFIIVTITVTRV